MVLHVHVTVDTLVRMSRPAYMTECKERGREETEGREANRNQRDRVKDGGTETGEVGMVGDTQGDMGRTWGDMGRKGHLKGDMGKTRSANDTRCMIDRSHNSMARDWVSPEGRPPRPSIGLLAWSSHLFDSNRLANRQSSVEDNIGVRGIAQGGYGRENVYREATKV